MIFFAIAKINQVTIVQHYKKILCVAARKKVNIHLYVFRGAW